MNSTGDRLKNFFEKAPKREKLFALKLLRKFILQKSSKEKDILPSPSRSDRPQAP